MGAVDGRLGGVVTRVGTRMAPAPAGGPERSARTTFAVGKLTWRRSEIRLVEPRRLGQHAPWRPGSAAETVH
jgi:hypothetical protein